jgi:hypothetical protein
MSIKVNNAGAATNSSSPSPKERANGLPTGSKNIQLSNITETTRTKWVICHCPVVPAGSRLPGVCQVECFSQRPGSRGPAKGGTTNRFRSRGPPKGGTTNRFRSRGPPKGGTTNRFLLAFVSRDTRFLQALLSCPGHLIPEKFRKC